MGNGGMGMGHRAWGMGQGDKETRRQGRIYPILNAHCPMPIAQFPIPNAQCPLPHSPYHMLTIEFVRLNTVLGGSANDADRET
ncbi:MAG: hypothetical protein KME31_12985 [Tolypothrix carrinoi HA7290-LM1]|jgi:hypothetical protein|nr:hypothetical protein [Tolypothrix carrinoi HA7290-LM1]